MTPHSPTRTWNVSGLRTRYAPRSRIGHGLLSACPWLNILLLLFFFWLMSGRLILEPGVTLDLPRGPFAGGSRPDLIAVVLSVRGAANAAREDIVFFNDLRFRLRNADQVEGLGRAIADRLKAEPDATLVVQADRNVPHGTIMDVLDLAMGVGVRHVNLAARPR